MQEQPISAARAGGYLFALFGAWKQVLSETLYLNFGVEEGAQ